MAHIWTSLVIGKELWARKQVGTENKNEVRHGIGSSATTSCILVLKYMHLLENKTIGMRLRAVVVGSQ
jgi:hypothetical protein